MTPTPAANMDHTPQDVQGIFSSRGLRCTRQRRALFEALVATSAHPTADQLFKTVSPKLQGLSLATVYNTLEVLCDAGLVQKISAPGGCCRYDADTHNHAHLRCRQTGDIHDVPDDLGAQILSHIPRDVLQELEAKLGFKVEQVQVELLGEFGSEVRGQLPGDRQRPSA